MSEPRRHGWKARLRYRLDTALAGGTGIVIAWLGLFSLALVAAAGLVIAVAGIEVDPEAGSPSFVEGLWLSLQRTLDAGTGGGDAGWAFRAVSITVTLGGIFVVTALIGLVANGIDQKLTELRKGRSQVVETGHTVILGWSPKLFTILSELVVANESSKDACVVVMATEDKVGMEDELRIRVPDRRTTRFVCRTGDPSDPNDLEIVDPAAAGSIIVLGPEGEAADAHVVRTVLALMHLDPGLAGVRVVAEFSDAETARTIVELTGGRVLPVVSRDIIARVTAQICRQPGLSAVFQDLLDFDGAEIYLSDEPRLAGTAFGDALHGYPECSLVGIRRADGVTQLAPPMDTVFAPGDRAVVIAEDDSTVSYAEPRMPDPPAPPPPSPFPPPRQDRILALGWNSLGPLIAQELDRYLAPGSRLDVLADPQLVGAVPDDYGDGLQNIAAHVVAGDASSPREIEAMLRAHAYDHVLLLCYRETIPVAESDSRTLLSLLALHHLLPLCRPGEPPPSIVTELLDVRDVELASVTRAQDFVVSERITSFVLAQLAEDPERGAIFADLFDSDGREVSLHQIEAYLPTGEPLSVAALVEAGARHGQVVIGYKPADAAPVLNPPKSAVLTFAPGDQAIVIS